MKETNISNDSKINKILKYKKNIKNNDEIISSEGIPSNYIDFLNRNNCKNTEIIKNN